MANAVAIGWWRHGSNEPRWHAGKLPQSLARLGDLDHLMMRPHGDNIYVTDVWFERATYLGDGPEPVEPEEEEDDFSFDERVEGVENRNHQITKRVDTLENRLLELERTVASQNACTAFRLNLVENRSGITNDRLSALENPSAPGPTASPQAQTDRNRDEWQGPSPGEPPATPWAPWAKYTEFHVAPANLPYDLAKVPNVTDCCSSPIRGYTVTIDPPPAPDTVEASKMLDEMQLAQALEHAAPLILSPNVERTAWYKARMADPYRLETRFTVLGPCTMSIGYLRQRYRNLPLSHVVTDIRDNGWNVRVLMGDVAIPPKRTDRKDLITLLVRKGASPGAKYVVDDVVYVGG